MVSDSLDFSSSVFLVFKITNMHFNNIENYLLRNSNYNKDTFF